MWRIFIYPPQHPSLSSSAPLPVILSASEGSPCDRCFTPFSMTLGVFIWVEAIDVAHTFHPLDNLV